MQVKAQTKPTTLNNAIATKKDHNATCPFFKKIKIEKKK
jgi:hypothetical protein